MQRRLRYWVSKPWSLAAGLGLLALLTCAVAFGSDAGVIWDDPPHREYGDRVLAWFESGFRDRSALTYRNLYLYGGLFDAPAEWLARHSPLGPFETRHTLCALVAVLGVVAVWRMATRIAGPRAGFLAAATLVLTPAWTGHGLFNPKDIPFATAVAWAIDACVGIALGSARIPWQAALRAGFFIGLALAVRSGGMFIAGYLVLAAFGRLAIELAERRRRGDAGRRLGLIGNVALRVAVALAIAWPVMLSVWPWAQVAPFTRPLAAFRKATQFGWGGPVLFDGHAISAMDLPASYLFTWFRITLPEIHLVAFACGLFVLATSWRACVRNPVRCLALSILFSSIALPLVGVLIQRPPIYDAHRHFLFLLPPLAALAGIALSAFFDRVRSPRVRTAVAAALGALAALTAADMIRLHPYEYTYFNRLSGGLPAAIGRFETDYWGASYREGFAWLVHNVEVAQHERVRVATCGVRSQLEYYRPRWPGVADRFVVVEEKGQADYLLATTRYDCHRVPGEVIHTVTRLGAPLLHVIRLPARRARAHPSTREGS